MADAIRKDTVSAYFVNAAVAGLGGSERERCLAVAGIPVEVLSTAPARVPAAAFSALWLEVGRTLDDEFFGLDSRRLKVGSFALICQAAVSCVNLDRALRRVLRGFAVFLDDIQGQLVIEDGQAIVRMRNRIQAPAERRFAEEVLLVMTHGLMCWLAGRRIELRQVAFAQPRPAHAHEYTRLFCEHVLFDAPVTSIRFDARALAAPVVQNAKSLKDFLDTAPQSVFLKYKNENGWTAKLRRRLRGCVSQRGGQVSEQAWPVLADIASELGTNPSTLRRRLEAEGTSYQAIKDQLRSDLAIHQLCYGRRSVEEIGAMLGFQDASAFHRAFKRWTGLQPGEYRRRRSDSQRNAGPPQVSLTPSGGGRRLSSAWGRSQETPA